MATKYLLTCSCHRSVAVDASQAGSSVHCECGAPLEVPTLRRLRQLESVEEGPPAGAPTWGPRNGLILLGLVVAVLAALPGIYLFANLPDELQLDPERVRQLIGPYVDGMTVGQSWAFWQEEVIGLGLVDEPLEEAVVYQLHVRLLKTWIAISFGTALVGLSLAVGALLWKGTTPGGRSSR